MPFLHVNTDEEIPAPIFAIPEGFSTSVPSSAFQLLTQWSQLKWLCGQHPGRERRKLRICLCVTLLRLCISVMILSSHLPSQTDAGKRKRSERTNKIPDISAAKYIFWLLIQLSFSILCLIIHFSSGSLLKLLQAYE